MQYSIKDILWYVLFAANGKATKIQPCLKEASIEYFFPMYYKERKIRGSERCERVSLPLLGNLIFVKSSRNVLDPVLKDVKSRFSISYDLYYKDMSDKKIIVVPENQMKNFIAVAGNGQEQIIYLPNEEVNLEKGVRVRITGGIFAGVEGVFMRVNGDKRVVVSIPNLFSVSTAYIASCYVQEISEV
ncbi:MAG: UpxY family transcription antiterminator [Prevotellaceae bacterium]|jgi:transcription antitermination factor NusG|nr:UpxY family transcription antiterminator [Prevotellaceae bacterium]